MLFWVQNILKLIKGKDWLKTVDLSLNCDSTCIMMCENISNICILFRANLTPRMYWSLWGSTCHGRPKYFTLCKLIHCRIGEQNSHPEIGHANLKCTFWLARNIASNRAHYGIPIFLVLTHHAFLDTNMWKLISCTDW